MVNPQQPELRRSARGATVDQSAKINLDEPPGEEGNAGPVPEESQAGHHPDRDQDKPDLDAFAEKLGVPPADED